MPPCSSGVADPLEIRSSQRVILPNLAVLDQTVQALLRRSAQKFDPSCSAFQGHSRLLEPTDRSATYDFLIMLFHSKQWPILYSFHDKRRFLSKIANFPTRVF